MVYKIDKLDLQILQIMSGDARIPLSDVAAQFGVSRAIVHQRIAKMIKFGTITGSGYHVNPKALGYHTCTFVGINLERGSMYKDVVSALNRIPEVVECHYTTGNYTMMVKLYACDNEHLMQLLNGKIQQIPGVISTETLISLDQTIARQLPINNVENIDADEA